MMNKTQIAAFMAARHPTLKYKPAADSWVGDGYGISDSDARLEAQALQKALQPKRLTGAIR